MNAPRIADAHAGQMEARLRHLGAILDALVAEAEIENGGIQESYYEGIAELREKLREAHERMEELRAEGSEDWDTVKARVESTWIELEAAFRRIADR